MTETTAPPTPERAEPYGTETALGGATREQLRITSGVYAEIGKVIGFHTPADGSGNGSTAQAVREVLGAIERAATEASKHQPKWRKANGCAEFAEMNPPALRQLAALCRLYAPGGDSIRPTAPESTPEDETAQDALPGGTLTVEVTDETRAEVDASVAEHERQVLAEREPTITVIDHTPPLIISEELLRQVAEDTAGMREAFIEKVKGVAERDLAEARVVETVDQTGMFHAHANLVLNPRDADVDPFTDPAPISYVMPAPILFTAILSDPFSNPFPISAAEWDRARGFDDIPF